MTPTVTQTNTITPAPTQTTSPTPTPSTGGHICSPPYPNPCDGKHPVCFNVQAKGNCTVTYDVYTTAFKKLFSYTTQVNGNTTLSWALKDKVGNSCSNGLYYLRVSVKGDQGTSSQIIKILILR
jgi:hypothetical protein